ncbi:MAG: glutamine amidotransferase [Planctomycetaceae bacterium]
MIEHRLILGAPHWLVWAAAFVGLALALLAWSYIRRGSFTWARVICAALKATSILALAACLVEPRLTGVRPRPGSNLFLVVADDSRSLQLADRGSSQSRGRQMQDRLSAEAAWLTRLSQDFDLRRYAFDSTLRPLKDFSELTLAGPASNLTTALAALGERFRGQPVAGILVLTDGNTTESAPVEPDWKQLPPLYPVALGSAAGLVDLSVARVTVSQTNFEEAPVTIAALIAGQGVADRNVVVRVVDVEGREVERRATAGPADDQPRVERFLLRPERAGISFYTVHAFLEGEADFDRKPGASAEATLANNRRLATIDRGGGPYRVLYVGGRPNWEFKFLRRALAEDDEVHLMGLLRIAKREPRMKFMGGSGERTNPLFRGFGNQNDEQAEQYDEPVLIRLGAENQDELRGGFPKTQEDLFRYHAVILDEIEAAFFTQDQQSLLQQFVSRRGGGFLMLGGKESFAEGAFRRTAIGEMLPVYVDRAADGPQTDYRLRLTREGWLQPWVRLRANETDETKRLAAMPPFATLNRTGTIKPGATVVAEVETPTGELWPALVVQPFGRGRAAALLVGDLWRWHMRRANHSESDLEKSWRQTVRWLVADVPRPVEAETRPGPGGALPGVEIVVRAHDRQFAPLDNAHVALTLQTPDRRQVELSAEAGDSTGEYVATFAPRAPGAYRAQVAVTAADGSEVGRREVGWAVEPDTDEFRSLAPNQPLLERLARETGGEVLAADQLEEFVASLPNRKVPIIETWTYPLWHTWTMFTLALASLAGEWGLRRWKGLP